jgi:hypothetical protein
VTPMRQQSGPPARCFATPWSCSHRDCRISRAPRCVVPMTAAGSTR